MCHAEQLTITPSSRVESNQHNNEFKDHASNVVNGDDKDDDMMTITDDNSQNDKRRRHVNHHTNVQVGILK